MVEYNKHFEAKIISSESGYKKYGRNYYKLTTTYRPSFQDIRVAQEKLGYHPDGYGGPDNVDKTQEGKKWVTRWESSSSCE